MRANARSHAACEYQPSRSRCRSPSDFMVPGRAGSRRITNHAGQRRIERDGRDAVEVDAIAFVVAIMPTQLPIRDREQVAAKASVATKPVEPLDAGEERPLDQFGAGVADFVDEEASDRLVVAREQFLTRRSITGPPSVEAGRVIAWSGPVMAREYPQLGSEDNAQPAAADIWANRRLGPRPRNARMSSPCRSRLCAHARSARTTRGWGPSTSCPARSRARRWQD